VLITNPPWKVDEKEDSCRCRRPGEGLPVLPKGNFTDFRERRTGTERAHPRIFDSLLVGGI